MIVLGALDLTLGLLATCGRVASAGASQGQTSAVTSDDPAELAGYLTFVVMSLVSIVVGAVILTAGIRLSRRTGRGFGTAAAIIAMIPVSCLFVLTVPIGAWVLKTLRRDDVRALLDGPSAPYVHPAPPAGYPQTG